MGFFAISATNSPKFSVSACHFNFWCVPRNWRSFDYLCDIGIRIKLPEDFSGQQAGPKRLITFSVYLPFKTDSSSFSDLSSSVLTAKTAALIFGRPVEVDQPNRMIRYDGSSVAEKDIVDEVVPVQPTAVSIVPDKCGPHYSVWDISLSEVSGKTRNVYTRFRFRVKDAGRTWISKGWASGKRGALIDLRICDVRESVEVKEWDGVERMIVPIEKLFCFVILPEQFLANTVSPQTHYQRLLEGETWRQYIDIGGDRHKLRKLVIFQWRNSTPPSAVDVNSPFRIFLDVSEEFGWRFLFLSVLAFFIAAFGGAVAQDLLDKLGLWNFIARIFGYSMSWIYSFLMGC